MIFSYSRLSLFEQCPNRFRLRYLEGLEEPVTDALALGRAVHRTIELIIGGADVEEAIHIAYAESDFHPGVRREELERLVRNAGVRPGMGETERHFEIDLSPGGPAFQGYIDLIVRRPSGVLIVDWKTNRTPYNARENHQLPLYAWALMELEGRDEVEGFLFFVRTGERSPVSDIRFTRQEVETSRRWAEETAREILRRIEAAGDDPARREALFPPKPSALCRACPFAAVCITTAPFLMGKK